MTLAELERTHKAACSLLAEARAGKVIRDMEPDRAFVCGLISAFTVRLGEMIADRMREDNNGTY